MFLRYSADAADLPLVFAPESGNMLGGTVVNITGPCFNEDDRVECTFDGIPAVGHVVSPNRAICVQPFLMAQGYVRFQVSVGSERYKWRGLYFVGMFMLSIRLCVSRMNNEIDQMVAVSRYL